MRPPGSNPEGAAFVFAGANPPTPSFSAYFVLIVISKAFVYVCYFGKKCQNVKLSLDGLRHFDNSARC